MLIVRLNTAPLEMGKTRERPHAHVDVIVGPLLLWRNAA